MRLEDAWLSVWAKSVRDERGVVVDWLPLHQHLDDTAAVAARLVDGWVSPQVISTIARDLPDGSDGARRLACWLAAIHDVGKASPAFACQVRELADHMRRVGFAANPRLMDDPERRAVNHALVGHMAVREWLADEFGFDFTGVAGQLASVVGSHHGITPDEGQLAKAEALPHLHGVGVWAQVRWHVLARATDRLGGGAVFERYRDVELSKPSQVLLTAIVIVADWIASNADLFPPRPLRTLHEPHTAPDDTATEQRAAAAWSALNLPPQWVAEPYTGDVDGFLKARFGRVGARARSVQVEAVAVARAQCEPGLVIVEAPMGSGKTEAALMAAEVMAGATGADGVFVALPTQATTDAMFARVRTWLDMLTESRHAVTISLAHGKAHLNDDFAGLVRKGRFAAVGEDEDEAAIAHWWLSGRKKSGLASFVVGTIDQVLFAGLKSRHVMLRHLALAGKVVVIDEVHAYDVYMSQYLHRVLEWLGAYRVPIVLLSATLPDQRRAELLRAYDIGRATVPARTSTGPPGYPVICGSGGMAPRSVALAPGGLEVELDRLSDDLDTLVAYLRRHLADGGCAVIVRNTVGRVQETADRLITEFGEDNVTIAHSRFLGCDRSRIDRELVSRFGPPDSEPDRPTLHIVVASQVVEQSLDVDFDLMVTDLAPADLVLQRLGRLYRHDRPRPAGVGEPRCALTGVEDWCGSPVVAVPGSRRVYGEHTLLRAAALFVDRASLRLPGDIAPLVQRAYGQEPLGPHTWRPALVSAADAAEAQARRRVERAREFLLGDPSDAGSLVEWLRAGAGDAHEDSPQGAAQVRDGAESLEVLVVQRDRDGGLVTPCWVPGGGEQIPLDTAMSWKQARLISACSLRLPLALSHGGVIDAVIAELEGNHFTSFDQNPLLKGQLVLVLDEHRTAELHGFALTYDLRRGLIHERD